MGSPFPIIELCRDLNHMGDHGCTFELSEEMMQKNKATVKEIQRLRDEADRVGLGSALPALEDALSTT